MIFRLHIRRWQPSEPVLHLSFSAVKYGENLLRFILFLCELLIFGYHLCLKLLRQGHNTAVGVRNLLDVIFVFRRCFRKSVKTLTKISLFFLLLPDVGGALLSCSLGGAYDVQMVRFYVSDDIFKLVGSISPRPFGIRLLLSLSHLFLVKSCDVVHLINIKL